MSNERQGAKFFFSVFLAVLGVRCCMQALSSCGEQGYCVVVVGGLLIGGGLSLWSTGSKVHGLL